MLNRTEQKQLNKLVVKLLSYNSAIIEKRELDRSRLFFKKHQTEISRVQSRCRACIRALELIKRNHIHLE